MKLYAKKLSIKDNKKVYSMLQRIGPNENKFSNPVNGMSFAKFKKWLIVQDNWSHGIDLPRGYVRQTVYWLYLKNTPIGYGKVREKLTPVTKKFGGHIGIAIDPLYRGHGYANFFLSFLVKQAKKKNVKHVLSTVEKNNIASKKTHLKCGGKIVKENKERYFFIFD